MCLMSSKIQRFLFHSVEFWIPFNEALNSLVNKSKKLVAIAKQKVVDSFFVLTEACRGSNKISMLAIDWNSPLVLIVMYLIRARVAKFKDNIFKATFQCVTTNYSFSSEFRHVGLRG